MKIKGKQLSIYTIGTLTASECCLKSMQNVGFAALE